MSTLWAYYKKAHYLVTNSLQQNLSWEADSRSASELFPPETELLLKLYYYFYYFEDNNIETLLLLSLL
jgi:hypothetical protein